MAGVLDGIRVIEFTGLGPAPMCGMMLADHGAEVIRIDRPGTVHDPHDALARSRRSIMIDLKQAEGVVLARELSTSADALIEGFRPGVMERLGLGPEILLADNPKLIYGRMTGWGQDGPLAHAAGHDINYVALSGILATIGPASGKPLPPANYLGDFGGGGMMLAFAVVAGILGVKLGRPGQVIDAAMVEGAGLLGAMTWSWRNAGEWSEEAGCNMLDGGAHFYDTYECADGKFIALGAIEPQFYSQMRDLLGLADDPDFDAQMDRGKWPALKTKIAARIATKTRDEWNALLEGTDACFAPVLTMSEAPAHMHNRTRASFIKANGIGVQPAPAPRFGATPAPQPRGAPCPGNDTVAILQELGQDAASIAALQGAGVVAGPNS